GDGEEALQRAGDAVGVGLPFAAVGRRRRQRARQPEHAVEIAARGDGVGRDRDLDVLLAVLARRLRRDAGLEQPQRQRRRLLRALARAVDREVAQEGEERLHVALLLVLEHGEQHVGRGVGGLVADRRDELGDGVAALLLPPQRDGVVVAQVAVVRVLGETLAEGRQRIGAAPRVVEAVALLAVEPGAVVAGFLQALARRLQAVRVVLLGVVAEGELVERRRVARLDGER